MPIPADWVLALLLVIAAAAGWLVARLWPGRDAQSVSSALREDYFQGLRLLLNQQTEQALKVFTRLAEQEENTFEAHLLVGGLFQRRGEVDRAIRIHEALLAREDLTGERRGEALRALAGDYLKAGLLDRAEQLFRELAATGSHRPEAWRGLVALYEQEKDWTRAIAAYRELIAVDRDADRSVICHYHCELAELARAEGRVDDARACLRAAREGYPHAARVAMLRAELAAEMDDPRLAQRLYLEALERRSELVFELLPPLVAAATRAGELEGLDRALERLLKRRPALRRPLALAVLLEPDLPLESAVLADCAQRFLSSARPLSDILEAVTGEAEAPAGGSLRIGLVRNMLSRILADSPRYRCMQCGYDSRQFNWQCPGCKSWDMARPLDHLALNLSP